MLVEVREGLIGVADQSDMVLMILDCCTRRFAIDKDITDTNIDINMNIDIEYIYIYIYIDADIDIVDR